MAAKRKLFRAGGRALLAAILMALLSAAVVTAAEPGPTYVLQVDGLACPFCSYGIEKQLNRIAGVASIATDIRSGTMTVTMAAGAALSEAEARQAVTAAGFTLRGFQRQEKKE